MRRGRISVERDAEEIALSPRPRYRQTYGKRSNPYTTTGLDKFGRLYAELSAKRESIAKETGAPEAMVRFKSSKNGWIPVVIGAIDHGPGKKNMGGSSAGSSILGPVEKNNVHKDGELRRKDEGNDINCKPESISISVLDERSDNLVIPCSWFLKKPAFWILGVSAMWVKFIVCGASYLPALLRNPKTSQEGLADQEDGSRRSPRPLTHTVSAPSSPLTAHGDPTDFWATASPRAVKPKNIDPEHKHHHYQEKIFRRAVSMDNRPTRPERSDNFYRPAMAYDANLGATVMILALLCFVFYGGFCAIFFTCACLYLFTMFREGSERMNRNNGNRMVDLPSSEESDHGFMDRRC